MRKEKHYLWHRVVLFLCFAPCLISAQSYWYKGNTHVHTIKSDGDSSPDAVVRWYKEHGYNFVVINDHDYRTPVEGLNALFSAPDKFLVIPGVEVTDSFEGRQVHVNGINVNRTVLPQGGANASEIINRDARAIKQAGGVPQINHPNVGWSLSAEKMIAATEANIFELRSGNFKGGGDFPSTEEMWDAMLSAGRVIYGTGSDDAHRFKNESRNPGTAWIMLRANKLTAADIMAALERGDFYTTTGVVLDGYDVSKQEVKLEIAVNEDAEERYRTFFIGKGGQVLKRDDSPTPSYQFKGDELYVRVRVEASGGAVAWTQPIFLKKG